MIEVNERPQAPMTAAAAIIQGSDKRPRSADTLGGWPNGGTPLNEREAIAPIGYCQCGCGQKTRIAAANDARFGHVKGQPLRYVGSHGARKQPPLYVVEDRGHETPCWVCQRWRSPTTGYARICDGTGKGRVAHVVMWERINGPVPEGFELDHLCRVPPCINPEHLEPVTPAENVRRSRAAKLTWEAVDQIRVELSRGALQQEVADRFGVSRAHISGIATGRFWREDTR